MYFLCPRELNPMSQLCFKMESFVVVGLLKKPVVEFKMH